MIVSFKNSVRTFDTVHHVENYATKVGLILIWLHLGENFSVYLISSVNNQIELTVAFRNQILPLILQ